MLAAKLKWTGPLASENDANAFAAAEIYGTASSSGTDAVYVYLDAGIGGGLGAAGTPAAGPKRQRRRDWPHAPRRAGLRSGLSPARFFESYVGRNALLARYRHHGGRSSTLEDILAALADRNPAARKASVEWAWWLGRGLASLVSVMDPSRVVLGGPVSALYALVQHEVLDSLQKHMVVTTELPEIEVSPLGMDACAIGAALMLHHSHLSIDERLTYGAATPIN